MRSRKKVSVGVILNHHLKSDNWYQVLVQCTIYSDMGNDFPLSRTEIGKEDVDTLISELKMKKIYSNDEFEKYGTSNVCKIQQFNNDALTRLRERQLKENQL